MNRIRRIAETIQEKQNITLEELRKLLETEDAEGMEELFAAARKTAQSIYGNRIFQLL